MVTGRPLSVVHCWHKMDSAEAPDEKVSHENVEETTPVGEATALALPEGTLDPVYEAKAHILNNAVQEIGMGR